MSLLTQLRRAAAKFGQEVIELSRCVDTSHPDCERGENLFKLEKFAEAEESFLRAAADMKSRSAPAGVEAGILLALARTQLKLMKVREARETTQSAYELLKAQKPSPELSVCLDLRGCIQQLEGNGADAIGLFREALDVQQNLVPVDPVLLLECYERLASALQNDDELSDARDVFTQAAEAAEKHFGAISPTLATCLIDLGACQFILGDLKAGIRSTERAIDIHREIAGPMSEQVVQDLQSLASACEQAGDLGSAVRYYERAISIRERQVGGSPGDIAVLLMRLAETHSLLGNDAAVTELLQSAVGKLELGNDARHAEALDRLREHYTRQGRQTEAASLHERTSTLGDKKL
jgi:tetratricopeptide (TPR) repeat protein